MVSSKCLLGCSMLVLAPIVANAAGTYYTGSYKSPQERNRYTEKNYTTNQGTIYTQGTTYRRGYGAPAGSVSTDQVITLAAPQTNCPTTTYTPQIHQGLTFGASLSHEIAEWQFDMKQAGSILHYDNIHWNVFDANAKYIFGSSTPVQIDAGFRYGMQFGKSYMIDDDMTNGGYAYGVFEGNNSLGQAITVDVIGHAISTGSSSGGSMMGFNAGLGLTNAFKMGNLRITPSVGYRYLKYKLDTKENYGLAITTSNSGNTCISPEGSDEIQCDGGMLFFASDGNGNIIATSQILGGRENADENGDGYVDISGIKIPVGATYINMMDTYYYQQPSTSHSYEVEWSGPYVALDAVYDINQNNNVNARIELGLPGYTSTGDQPYRVDWQHPKSVEDKADMFSGLHLGLGANYMTALTDSVSLSVGFTYDYYKISGADANTYLNANYYETRYNALLVAYQALGVSEEQMLATDAIAADIAQIRSDCPGWVCNTGNEVNSFYKSMGIRVGLNTKF